MEPASLFQFCPRCGTPRGADKPLQPFQCDSCGFHYYFNPCLAVAAILLGPHEEALFIRRAKEPGKGKLAVPGGFVDIGETAEKALRREIKEEVNLEVGPLQFLCSAPNEYPYRGVKYPVLDLAFVCRAISIEPIEALDGVESFCWARPAEVDLNEIAFPSIRAALRHYSEWKAGRRSD
jgi:ADP-ribose pyrophosphatase YjhB (NUDIX family)